MDIEILQIIAKAQGKTIEQVKKEITNNDEVIETSLPVKTKSKKQVTQQLPLWSDSVRGVPNAVLRSALFTATKRGKRQYFERQKIASLEGIEVVFTGPRLDQADLDVWEQCLHIARMQNLGNNIQFTASSFLKEIGRNVGKSDHEWLKGAFARLAGSVVEISNGKHSFFGALISGGRKNEDTGFYELYLNPKISSLYGNDGWTAQDWEQRKKLIGKPLALWLHSFYSTHSNPYEYKIETIWRLCGSETKELYKFKQNFISALKDLAEATGWHCSTENNKAKVLKILEKTTKRLA
jgi:hypothetical protein